MKPSPNTNTDAKVELTIVRRTHLGEIHEALDSVMPTELESIVKEYFGNPLDSLENKSNYLGGFAQDTLESVARIDCCAIY